ncbi:MAG: rnhA operon protein [Halodesulfurarchaeum sp.]
MTDLPADVLDEATRLTRLARDASDPDAATAYREDRDELLDEHGYEARVREESDGDVLVCYPQDWVDAEGVANLAAIEDTDDAVEVPLRGAGDPDDWDAIESHNRAIVETVRREYGPPHGENAAAFADFMGNHYGKRMEDAARPEVTEFLHEYFPRNAWPSPEQREAIEESLRHVFEVVDEPPPL